MGRRDFWIEGNPFAVGTHAAATFKFEETSACKVIHVREVLPGDVVLTADEAAKVLEAIRYVDYLPDSVTTEAIQILNRAMRE